jgi:ABC-type transporter Mla subunit MlaD
MFSEFTKRRVLVGSGVSVLAIGAVAFAFWTTSGSGSGSATAGTDAGVSVSGDPSNGIYPGGSVPMTTTVANSSQYSREQHGSGIISTA